MTRNTCVQPSRHLWQIDLSDFAEARAPNVLLHIRQKLPFAWSAIHSSKQLWQTLPPFPTISFVRCRGVLQIEQLRSAIRLPHTTSILRQLPPAEVAVLRWLTCLYCLDQPASRSSHESAGLCEQWHHHHQDSQIKIFHEARSSGGRTVE